MKIAVIHNHPIHYKHLLFESLAATGIHVDALFAARSSNLRTAAMQPEGVGYDSHFLCDGTYENLPRIRTAWRCMRLLGRCRPDVVVISGYSYLPTWVALIWAKLHRKPVVLWFESNVFDHRRTVHKELLKRVFIRMCTAGHVYGKSNREYLEQLGMSPEAIIEKRATVDFGVFSKRRAKLHDDFRRFVYVGRFSPEKNLICLLDAFSAIRSQVAGRPPELVLVGYGPDEAKLKQRVSDLSLEDSVVFAGPKTQDEVSRVLAEADCLVLPSLSETWGLVANEALCTGLPIIVSNRCGCARDLVTEDTGWVFDAEDTSQLASTLANVCRLSLERLQQMGAAAVELGSEYSPDKCAQRIAANVASLLQAGRGAV